MKIKFGAIVTDGRGKIGGHVASKNRGGAYMRTKVTPSNPNTSAQVEARSLLSSLSQSFRSLTSEQILSWNNAVKDWSSTDIFGDIKNPTGLNLFVKINTNLSNVGLAVLNAPPAKMEMPATLITGATISVADGSLSIDFSDASADGTNVLVRATPVVSNGVSFVKSEYRVIGNRLVDGTGLASDIIYSDKFGTPAIGSKIFVSIQYVLASGQKSTTQSVVASIVA